jgi:predicted lipoprotein with Yx(FWY)xxD motif
MHDPHELAVVCTDACNGVAMSCGQSSDQTMPLRRIAIEHRKPHNRTREEHAVLDNDRSNVARTATLRPSLTVTATALAMLAALTVVLVHPAASHAAPAKGTVVSTASSSLGRILVDVRGRTLYLFEKDKNDKSACAGQCATFWPPLIASGKPVAGAGAKASLLGTTKRADGRMQVTYNRHPLYTFAKDTKKGQTGGEELSAFGAKWYVVSPAGAKIEKRSAASRSGGGY